MQSEWNKLHQDYSKQDWINHPNTFAVTTLPYLKHSKTLLDLGAGQGQDSRFFAENGLKVTSTDISSEALRINKEKSRSYQGITIQEVDLQYRFPFKGNSFDVVYAHLSLHYFDNKTTQAIFEEICRVLKPDGIFAILLNSTSDPEYQSGEKLESDYFEIEGKPKRYFNVVSLQKLLTNLPLQTILLDDNGVTVKDAKKGVNNLIRYIGKLS